MELLHTYTSVHVRRVFIHSFIMMLKNYIATTTGTTVCWSLISHDIIIPLGIFLISSYLYAVCTKNRCTFTTVCLGYPVYVCMWWYVCAYTDVQDLVPGTQLFLIIF